MINHNHKFIYVKIPRTSSTTTYHMLEQAFPESCERLHVSGHTHILDLVNRARPGVNYYKFTIVRNPWDRLYSSYCYLKQRVWLKPDDARRGIDSFEQYVTEGLQGLLDKTPSVRLPGFGPTYTKQLSSSSPDFFNQIEWISDISGKVMVHDIYRFEDGVETNCEKIAGKLKIKQFVKIKGNPSARERNYRDVYTSKMIDITNRLFEKDITYFGYKFE